MTDADSIFTAEQDELRSTAARFLADKSPSEVTREVMETPEGFDEAVWKEMASLGWPGIHVSEDLGGVGYGFSELAVLLEEMGKALLPAPFLSSAVLATSAISNLASDAQKKELLGKLVDGSMRAALAFVEPEGRWDTEGITAQASKTGDSYQLNGTKRFVIDGGTADLLVVIARLEDGLAGLLVEPGASGVSIEKMETLDPTRKQAHIDFNAASAELLGGADAEQGWERAVFESAIALSAESLGGAQACLDSALSYAKERTAFGRAIGSFQAVKHRLADLLMKVENARSGVYYAAWTLSQAPDDVGVAAHIAKAYASEAFMQAAADNIQIHGGMGFTWEHDAHLYFRRAKSSEIYLGDGAYHRELLAQELGV